MQSLNKVKEALLTVSQNVGHLYPDDGTVTHIVWAEDGEGDSLHANNKKDIQCLQGTIDLFALPNEIHMADDIQQALNEADICYSLNTVQAETKFIHYEWIFEVT